MRLDRVIVGNQVVNCWFGPGIAEDVAKQMFVSNSWTVEDHNGVWPQWRVIWSVIATLGITTNHTNFASAFDREFATRKWEIEDQYNSCANLGPPLPPPAPRTVIANLATTTRSNMPNNVPEGTYTSNFLVGATLKKGHDQRVMFHPDAILYVVPDGTGSMIVLRNDARFEIKEDFETIVAYWAGVRA